jgi:DNA-binding beta-propeller fold protein YncE
MPIRQITIIRMLLSILAALLTCTGHAAEPSPLVLERTIPLPGVSGRIDHMAIDVDRKRLFVAELGNGTVDVIDLATGKAVHRISGLKEPQGTGYSGGADLLAVANAGDGTVRLFRSPDFSPLGTLDLRKDADNVRVDPQSGRMFVGYGDGGIAELGPSGQDVASRMRLSGHPEGFQVDIAANRAFVNVPDAGQIAILDLASGHQVATWRVPGLASNFPMALDRTATRAAVVFRSPARLVLFETKNGTVTTNIATCRDADDVFFDTKRPRLYISCGEGAVDVMQEEAGGYRLLSRVKTRDGARTSLFVPGLDRLFVAARGGLFGLGSAAAILVFRPQP